MDRNPKRSGDSVMSEVMESVLIFGAILGAMWVISGWLR